MSWLSRTKANHKKISELKPISGYDFNASYAITDSFGKNLGKIARKGMRSIWKATYNIFDHNENQKYKVQERKCLGKSFRRNGRAKYLLLGCLQDISSILVILFTIIMEKKFIV